MNPDVVSIDLDRAILLAATMTEVAEQIRSSTRSLTVQLYEAHQLLSGTNLGSLDAFGSTAALLDDHQTDLASRIRMAMVGGDDVLPGLEALDVLQSNWALIATQGNREPGQTRITLEDLKWAAENLSGEAAAAAQWLINHPAFMAAAETAKNNDGYIDLTAMGVSATTGGLAHGKGDSQLSLDDIAAFKTKMDTFATIAPYLEMIDTAGQGGDADGLLSRDDFEAFIEGYDLPPEARRAAQQILDEGAFHKTDRINFGTILDVMSYVPVIGDVVDGSRALYYGWHGDWAMAAIYAVGLLPLPGLSGSSARTVRKVAQAVGNPAGRKALREVTQTVLTEGLHQTAQRGIRSVTKEQLTQIGIDTLGNVVFEQAFQSFDDILGHFESGWLRYPIMATMVVGARRATRTFNFEIPDRLDSDLGDDELLQRIFEAQVAADVKPEAETWDSSENHR